MTTVSIIICTRNRAQSLLSTLDSVAVAAARAADLNSGNSTEIILVDNGSTDETATVARHWAASHKISVSIVFERRPGLAVAKNAGIRHASGAVLVFTDDDVRLAPDYIELCVLYYSADQAPVIRGGRIELGDPMDLPFSIKTSSTDAVLTADIDRNTFIPGCMAMACEVPEMIGAFDERFGAGAPFKAGEDTDFIHRAYDAKIRIEYKADMIMYHWHGRKSLDEIRKMHRNYCIGGGALRAKQGLRNLLRYTYYDVRNIVRAPLARDRLVQRRSLSPNAVLYWSLFGVALYFFTRISKG